MIGLVYIAGVTLVSTMLALIFGQWMHFGWAVMISTPLANLALGALLPVDEEPTT